MMTDYILEVGYSYAHGTTLEKLKELASTITIKEIREKSILIGALELVNTETLDLYLQVYKTIPTPDAFYQKYAFKVQFYPWYIVLTAYGSDETPRLFREMLCKAFILVFLEKAYSKGYSINITTE